jgi:hypothetical protein
MFESRLLRRMYEPKRVEITRGWTKLYDEKVHNILLFGKYY